MAYYVTLKRDQRVAWLAGPFNRHGDALRIERAAVNEARRVDPWTHFDPHGTTRVKTPTLVARIGPGKLNARLGLPTEGRA